MYKRQKASPGRQKVSSPHSSEQSLHLTVRPSNCFAGSTQFAADWKFQSKAKHPVHRPCAAKKINLATFVSWWWGDNKVLVWCFINGCARGPFLVFWCNFKLEEVLFKIKIRFQKCEKWMDLKCVFSFNCSLTFFSECYIIIFYMSHCVICIHFIFVRHVSSN